jgi:hypothetical protein
MDEFEQGLEKILASKKKIRQDVATKSAQDEIARTAQLRSEAEAESMRRQEAKAENEKEIALCADFHAKNLKPILDTVNEKVASGKGVVSTFPKDPDNPELSKPPFTSMLGWAEDDGEHLFGFRINQGQTKSVRITVFAGEFDGRSRYDQPFIVEGNDLSQVKKHVLQLLSNPQTTVVIPKVDSFIGQQVEPKGLDPD